MAGFFISRSSTKEVGQDGEVVPRSTPSAVVAKKIPQLRDVLPN